MEELRKLLLNVEDTYDDFVGCVCCAVKGYEDGIAEMVRFIKSNPEALSSDIIEHLDDIGY